MKKRYPMSSYPNGWYAVTSLAEVQQKKVVPIKSLGRDLVVFQTESGAICVLDAHCPHQGAHLGHGGKIKGETIECPFHKWAFDTTGKCQHIPYCQNIPKTKKAEIHSYPVIERLGLILIYCSSDNSPPTWQMPQFEDDLVGKWTAPMFSKLVVKTHVQELAENGFDVPHFHPIHGSEENSIELDKKQPFGPQLFFALNLVYPGNGIGKFGKKVGVHAEWRFNALGVFDNHVTLRDYPMELRQYFFFTPLDEEHVQIQIALRINKDKIKLPMPFQYFVIKLIEKQNKKILLRNFEEDRPIWENKVFRQPPILCEGDGPIAHLRNWMKQFYTQETLSEAITACSEQMTAKSD
jgi:phenylpropionate dioxygenase-like ring-hydroxylating dioxygenase large terminal subunit